MTIRLGDKLFEGPHPIGAWTPPALAGVYCLMVPDARYRPFPYRVVYLGQSANFVEHGFPAPRQRNAGWLAIADYDSSIYIAACWMPRSTQEQRKAVERELVRLYEPECNEVLPDRSPVAH